MRIAGCLPAFLPPLAAALAWPVLYFGTFLVGIAPIPFIMFACVAWAWVDSDGVAGHLFPLLGWPRVRILRGLVFCLQVLGIVASWPLFLILLRMVESMGYKLGWS